MAETYWFVVAYKVTTHRPAVHPVLQASPQPPQLALSVCSSTQPAPHWVVGGGHPGGGRRLIRWGHRSSTPLHRTSHRQLLSHLLPTHHDPRGRRTLKSP